MNISPADARAAVRTFVLALTALSVSTAAMADDPTRLGPAAGGTVQPLVAPEPDAPSPVGVPRAGSGISATTLAAPDPAASGALGGEDKPLPSTLWQGTKRELVLALLPRIRASQSPTLNSLAFRLLASPGDPPRAADGGTQSSALLVTQRAERLANALGRPDSAYALLATGRGARADEAREHVAAELAFLSGDAGGACGIVRSRADSWNAPFWDQASLTCAILEDRPADARLSLDVLREGRGKPDPFLTLAESSLGKTAAAKPIDAVPAPRALALAIIKKAALPISRKALEGLDPASLKVVASMEETTDDIRLEAAERATVAGALTPATLADMYMAVPLTQEDRDTPIGRAEGVPAPRGRAILFAAAHDATSPQSQAMLLAALLSKARKSDVYFAVARAADPMIRQANPSGELSPAAIELVRGSYADDNAGAALGWLGVAPLPEGEALLPLARIGSGEAAPSWGSASMKDIFLPGSAQAQGTPSPDAVKHLTAAAELLTALGRPGAAVELANFLDSAPLVPASGASILLIQDEARQHHLGGTVLAVLAALGDQALVPGPTLDAAISGLASAGLNDEARQLATEAAIANGL